MDRINYGSVHVSLRSIFCTDLEKRLIDCADYYDDGNSQCLIQLNIYDYSTADCNTCNCKLNDLS